MFETRVSLHALALPRRCCAVITSSSSSRYSAAWTRLAAMLHSICGTALLQAASAAGHPFLRNILTGTLGLLNGSTSFVVFVCVLVIYKNQPFIQTSVDRNDTCWHDTSISILVFQSHIRTFLLHASLKAKTQRRKIPSASQRRRHCGHLALCNLCLWRFSVGLKSETRLPQFKLSTFPISRALHFVPLYLKYTEENM